ncbi:hypothetical protein [Sorangium sp. So ce131]|uniref:hypothetical protein n=1 Tax=Sorangium sp. So ce131 TaxID=3133282 RepID=UPI003F62D389
MLLLISMPGCGDGGGCPPESDMLEGEVEAAASALLNPNSLDPRALDPSHIDPDALSAGALAPNRLEESGLAESALRALRDPGEAGRLSRQLLRYIVGCALSASQSLRFSWHDTLGALHEESYRGLMGLAPSWSDEPLSASRQQWVSACVASRVNSSGASVMISSRAAHAALRYPDALEVERYPDEEGAFWGNLFTSPPRLFACYNDANVENSRALGRDCAAGRPAPAGGSSECANIHIVGSCDLACDARDVSTEYRRRYRSGCGAGPDGPSSAVITTFLP